ncbi:hypothetical protein CRG98_010091 [Punica granatum]|uniref:G-patch domain-containing protein n=1 Tax=Punica granatum TaxID=22663 RepID=A0A2I0KNW8_PUNGR|nr:hypothetical protein CRG98_010091 [Punica granatum]
MIRPTVPGPSFILANQDQSLLKSPNVQANPLPDHGLSSGPTINMIIVCTMRKDESQQESPTPFVIEYVSAGTTVGFTGSSVAPAPFIIEVPAQEPYQDSKNPETASKAKAPIASEFALEASPIPQEKVTEEETEVFMKVIKASEYKVVEQKGKSPTHISLLPLFLISEPHREALLRVLIAAQVSKEIAPDRIEETISSIFSNTISFSDDEFPSEGWAHLWELHIVCKCNNFVVGQVMIDNGSALNVYPVSTLKQMNVDLNCICPSKTAVRAFDGSRREVLDIPNAFSLLLGRPWIHSAGAVPSSLHQRLKFIAGERLITVKGEEDYAIYKEMTIPYISIGDDENFPFHSFDTISIIWDYGEVRPSHADRMVGKVLLRHNYVLGTGKGAQGQIIEARRDKHLHRLAAYYRKINRDIPVPPLSHFFSAPPHIVGGTLDGPFLGSDAEPIDLSAICAVTEETPLGVHIRLAQKNEELNN